MVLNMQTLLICVITLCSMVFGERSFVIDYERDTFLKDGEPFRYISGSIHYHRVPEFYWRDRLEKMSFAGLNAIQIYIPWNYHELSPGNYSFDGNRDFVKFIQLAQDIGLLVILRPGPYICGEWDFGGFPPWILKDTPNVILRSSDPDYIGPVDRWLDVLLPMVKPLLYVNGGPVISVQVENEYGSYFTCEQDYLRYLRSKFISHLGDEVVLFTTDGAGTGYLKCGALKGLYATVDFGITLNPLQVFEKSQRVYEPHGPLVNSEFYAGWLDHWGYPFVTVNGSTFAHSLDLLLQTGANVNIYMFHGGTNFGYTNGANYKPIQSHITSYDYDAPMSEAGDITPKYMEIRKVIGKYRKLPPGPVPPSTFKAPYGKVRMEYHVALTESISSGFLNQPIKSQYPLSMEQVGKGQSYAYIMYTTKLITNMRNVILEIDGIRDRGYVMINSGFQGILTRDNGTKLVIEKALPGDELTIFVENLGHINYGSALVNNSKGIISNVSLGALTLTDWDIYPVYLEDIINSWKPNTNLKFEPLTKIREPGFRDVRTPPTFWRGYLPIPGSQAPEDTYLDPRPFSKGHAFINGFNLGRYWSSLGPQVTLFVPKSVLKPYPDTNTIVLFEVEDAPCSEHASLDTCHVTFVDRPLLNKTVSDGAMSNEIQWDFDWHRQH